MKKIYVLISVLLLSSCTSAMWVSEKAEDDSFWSYKSVEGIPFYTKKEVFDQTTTYSRSWLKVTLKIDKKLIDTSGEKPKIIATSSQSFDKNVATSNYSVFDEIKKELVTIDGGDADKAKEIINKFLDIHNFNDFNSIKEVMISNTITPVWVVDEDSEYYLNAPLPWFGSSNLTQEINDNGTLSKAISNPDTKLSEGISSLIPFKEFLSAKHVSPLLKEGEDKSSESSEATKALTTMNFINPEEPVPDDDKLKVLYDISLGTIQTGYIYSFTNRTKQKPDAGRIPFNDKNGIFTRKLISDNSNAKKAQEDTNPKIGFSGNIILPKEK